MWSSTAAAATTAGAEQCDREQDHEQLAEAVPAAAVAVSVCAVRDSHDCPPAAVVLAALSQLVPATDALRRKDTQRQSLKITI
jgi:hypothetical protein